MIILIISIVTTFLAYRYNIIFNIDLTLLSIAIVFPLVFTIRGSFRRREKALQHLSKFRSALKTVRYFVMSNVELTEENKKEMAQILSNISEKTIEHLSNNYDNTTELDKSINTVNQFMLDRDETISGRLRDRVFRFMKDLHEAIENLHAINTHRTPMSLKAYCLIFIYIFPIIYAPSIISTIGGGTSQMVTYCVVIMTEFILITLYNIQDQLEYPFDDDIDDIKLDSFKIDR